MMYKVKQLYWMLQRRIRGYGDDDLWDAQGFITLKIRKLFKAYVRYYKKHGIGCPPELFDNDNKNNQCQKWFEVLTKIELAFDLHYEETIGSDKYFEKSTKQQLKDIDAKTEGFELFGKYYQAFWI